MITLHHKVPVQAPTFFTTVGDFPCTDIEATITIDVYTVFHTTERPNGSTLTTVTITGDIVGEPLDPTQPSYTGHYAEHGLEAINLKSSVSSFTFTIIAKGSDGSKVRGHETIHFTRSASGMVVEFDKLKCGSNDTR